MDNAQEFTKELSFKGIRDKLVIAAFSPGALVGDGSHALMKVCGDGKSTNFRWRPFTWNETCLLVKSLGFTMWKKSTNFKHKRISECRLRTIFCKTVGNPRYIFSYFVNGDLEEMIDTLSTQHMKMMSKTTTDALGTTAQIIKL